MFNNSKTNLKKVLILFIVLSITYSSFLLVGANIFNGLVSYAVDDTDILLEKVVEDEKKNEPIFEIEVDTPDIHKTQMEENTEFKNTVNLKLKNVKNIQLEDIENDFYDNSNEVMETADFKYVKTVFNKEEIKKVLGEKGNLTIIDSQENTLANLSLEYIKELELDNKTPQKYIKIIKVEDEDGNIKEEQQEEIRSYVTVTEEAIEIEYNIDFKNAKININSEINNEEINFVIENTKSIFDVQDLDNLNYLTQNIKYTYKEITDEQNEEEQEEQENLMFVQNVIKFKDTITRATMDVDNLVWSLGEINNINCTITLDTSSEKAELFKNPIFIIELPECVESVDAQNSIFIVENDENVFEEKNVSIVTLLGRKYILMRFMGEQTKDTIKNGNTNIILSLDLYLKEEGNKQDNLVLYYKNDTVTAYNNGNAFDSIKAKIETKAMSKDIVENIELIQDADSENQDDTIGNKTEIGDGFYAIAKPNKKYIKSGDTIEYTVFLYNTNTAPIESLKIENKLPDDLEYMGVSLFDYNEEDLGYADQVDTEDLVNYNEQTRTLEISLNDFPGAKEIKENDETKIIMASKKLDIVLKTTPLQDNTTSRVTNNRINIIKDEVEVPVDDIEVTVLEPVLAIETNIINDELNIDDMVELEVTVNNSGLVPANNTEVNINLPDEFEPYYVETEDSSYSVSTNDFSANEYIPAQSSYKIKLIAKYANTVEEDKNINITANINNDQTATWETKLLKATEEEINNKDIATLETEELNTSNEQINNVVNEETNFVLTQSLNKIIVSNLENTKEYEYDNVENAKVAIDTKNINDTTVTMEYKIVVKNEGNTPEYGKTIVDYVPEGLEFNQKENSNWHQAEDGTICSDALVNRLLNPGESVELAIKLSKKINDKNGIGVIGNFVTLQDASNNSALELKSLSAKTLSDSQKDASLVEVNVTKKTNKILYIVLAIVFVAVIVCAVIVIKRTSLKREVQ